MLFASIKRQVVRPVVFMPRADFTYTTKSLKIDQFKEARKEYAKLTGDLQ